MAKVVKVGIKSDIYKKIKKRVAKTEFENVQEYVNYVLEEVIKQVEEEDKGQDDDAAYSKEDEEKVKERLRALGYLD
jgi:hypothetical protein